MFRPFRSLTIALAVVFAPGLALAAPKAALVIGNGDSSRGNRRLASANRRRRGRCCLARRDPTDTRGGTRIANATRPGAIVAGGSGRNSPFTTALLTHTETPAPGVRTMFALVRKN